MRGPSATNRVVALLAPGAAVVAMMMPVFDAWAHARTHGAFVAGLLPYSDGRGYFAGALHLLHDGHLDVWNSRRPLNPAFLAGRLALSACDLRGAILVQAALASGSAFAAARAVSMDFGRAAGLVTYAAIMLFGAKWMPTTWTEPLGLTLGALSFAALWHALRSPTAASLVAGFALLGLAQNARAGALFALPLLVWWAARLARGAGTSWRAFAAAALGGLGVAWVLNRTVAAAAGADLRGGHGAFAYTLYSLTHEGRSWTTVFVDHPELSSLDDAAASVRIYALAVEELRLHPTGLLRGLWSSTEWFVYGWTDGLSGGLLDHRPWAQWCYFFALAAAVTWVLRRLRRVHGDDQGLSMVFAACAGMLASIPVIFLDGSERVFAATIPFLAALAAIAATSARPSAQRVTPAPASAHRAQWVLPAVWGAVIVLAAVVGPRLGRRTCGGWSAPPAPTRAPVCAAGEVALVVSAGPESPRVDLVESGARTFVPTIASNVFGAGMRHVPGLAPNSSAALLSMLPANTTLALAYDLPTRATMLVSGPRGWLDGHGRVVRACARLQGTELYQVTATDADGLRR